ncbi:VOC family protein [Pseudonocardia sp. TRM90224]|uniref:VOC family protein n=1 Tax=Pseudonocardia sp. TRM90224 TaxID=2812678 RepID=UPI001E421495|nr:VOC family protein [Pseudonocardia sp. TRM90224]
MTDPMDVLRSAAPPVDPDPAFARALRSRMERALLAPQREERTMTTTISARETALHALTPYLAVTDARAAIAFYVDVFGATRRGEPIVMPDGRVGHAELALGDSVVMLADEFPEIGHLAPPSRGGPTQSLRLEVDDPDGVVARAVAAGAVLERPVADSEHGRGGALLDPSGHRWLVERSSRVPDVVHASLWSPDAERTAAFFHAVLGLERSADGRMLEGAGGGIGIFSTQAETTLMVCYSVPDVHAAVALVRAAGGSAGEPTDEPYGLLADCRDDQGQPFAVWQGTSSRRPLGELVHVLLGVPDSGRARGFYGTALGWDFVPAHAPDSWTVRRGGHYLAPRTTVLGGFGDAVVSPSFAVGDVEAAAAAVRAAGGTAGEPTQRPFGLAADCRDDQGMPFLLLQP